MLKFRFLFYCLVLLNINVAASDAPNTVTRNAKDNITLVAILPNIPILLAQEMCSNMGGEITNRLFVNIAIGFFKTLHPSYQKFWLGASSKNGTWLWNDGTHVKLKTFPQKSGKVGNKDCLIYNRQIDRVEEADCSNMYSAVCNEGAGRNVPKLLLLLFRKHIVPLPQTRLLFMVDNDVTIGLKYESNLQFIKNLANTVVLSQKRSFGLGWYSTDASIISFNRNSSNCFVRTALDELFMSKVSTSHTLAIYYNAFKAVEEKMAKTFSKDSTLFLFFFAIRPDSGQVEDRNKLVRKLKDMGVKIIVITWGDNTLGSSLEEVASIIDDQLQLYSFDTTKNFLEAIRYLKTKRKFSWNDCSRVGRRKISNKPTKRFRCF